jgi:hypothetical protein
MDIEKYGTSVWPGLTYSKIGFGGEILWTQRWYFVCHKSKYFLDWRKNCQLFKYEPIPWNNSREFISFECRLWSDKMNANSIRVVC